MILVMFTFNENFMLHDDDFQPYNIYIERSSNLVHMHGSVKENGYAISCSGNKHLFKIPKLKTFSVELCFRYAQLSFKKTEWKYFPIENAEWMYYFHYDKKSRCGKAVAFEYQLDGKIIAKLLKIDGIKKEVLATLVLDNIILEEEKEYSVKIIVNGNRVFGNFIDRDFNFETEIGAGDTGVGRANFPGELIFRSVELTSDDVVDKTVVVKKQTAIIPMLNGGMLPYKLNFEICKINEIYEFNYEFTGGVYFRPIDDNGSVGQFSVEHDRFINPYVKLLAGDKAYKINIKNGRLTVSDPNVHWEFLKEYFESPNLPIDGRVGVDSCFAFDKVKIIFGYDELEIGGYLVQKGGPSEFVFDTNGNLLYQGAALTGNTYEFLSPADKNIIDMIPKDLPNYEIVVKRLQENHYFMENEEINLTFRMRTRMDEKNIKVLASLNDVFDEVLIDGLDTNFCKTNDNFMDLGYKELNYSVKINALKLGVYRGAFYVYDGEELIKKANVTFEVLSTQNKIAPPLASGLPFMYSTPNEQRYLDRDVFDPWNPMPSCDMEHYFSCVAFTPSVGIKKRIWEAIKPFNREWFMWLDSRTSNPWDYELFIDGVKNADYMQYQLPNVAYRYDLWIIDTYNPNVLKILHEFLDKNPHVASKLKYSAAKETFTLDDLNEIQQVCRKEWYDFACKRVRELMLEQNETFKKLNPKFKRAYYGPFSIYTSPYGTYNIMRHFGLDPSNDVSEQYSGFMQFEDYPFSSSYFSYRGAFAAMTIKLHNPNLKIYPEMYHSSYGGCPDGALAFANPPLAKYDMPIYYHLTQAYEYAFCTAFRSKEGYNYWYDHGFMLRDMPNENVENFVHGWKYVAKHTPAMPLRTTAFIADYDQADERYNGDFVDSFGFGFIHNISEEGQGFLYGCARECGLAAGFALKFDTVRDLRLDETDILILPSLENVSKDIVDHIRKLYNEGVSLFAVSDVSGLEDIFGVTPHKRTLKISELKNGMESEYILPMDAELKYDAKKAEVIVCADDNIPILMKNHRAAIINAPISSLGTDSFTDRVQYGRECISKILRAECKAVLEKLSNPLVKAEGCGISAFIDKNGNTVLVLFDYSPYDQKELHTTNNNVTVKLNIPNIRNVECEKEVNKFYENGFIKEFKVKLRPQEATVVKLCM